MDADQLLLEWATKQIKPWLEGKLKVYNYYRPSYRDPLTEMAVKIAGATIEHLVNCTPRVYAIPSHDWECGCYSEYTRDDRWMIHTYVTCPHRLFTQMEHELSPYDMPEIIQQLAEEDEGCVYDTYAEEPW